jgi:hypothetical protein
VYAAGYAGCTQQLVTLVMLSCSTLAKWVTWKLKMLFTRVVLGNEYEPPAGVDGMTLSTSSPAFSNPLNAAERDTSYAQVSLNGGQQAQLQAQDFGLKVPSSKTINGIIVEIYGSTDQTTTVAVDSISLVKNYSATGTAKYWDSSTYMSTSDSTLSYGGSSDLWAATLSPSDVNDPGFGMVVNIKNESGYSNRNVYVNDISIKVYFS